MAIATVDMNEKLNRVINICLGGGQSVANVIAALNAAVTNLTGKTVTHDRTIEDPGPLLNPNQPQPP